MMQVVPMTRSGMRIRTMVFAEDAGDEDDEGDEGDER